MSHEARGDQPIIDEECFTEFVGYMARNSDCSLRSVSKQQAGRAAVLSYLKEQVPPPVLCCVSSEDDEGRPPLICSDGSEDDGLH